MEFLDGLTDIYLIKLSILAIVLSAAFAFINKLVDVFFKRVNIISEEKEKTIQSIIRSLLNYALIVILIIYAISPFVDVSGILAGAGVIGLVLGFAIQNVVKDILIGGFRIYEKQFQAGDFVKLNGKYTGTIDDVGIRYIQIRDWEQRVITIAHGDVKEIHNYNKSKMRIVEKVVVSHREDPEKIMVILNSVCEKLNNDDSDLLIHSNEVPIEAFDLYGLTSLNSNHHGYEYTIVGMVKDKEYWNASKKVRLEIAKAMYKNGVIIGETNVYHRTRLTTKV